MLNGKKLFILCSLLLLVGIIVYQACKKKELRKNGILITGKIVSDQSGSKGQRWFNYEFEYKGRLYKRDKSVDVLKFRTFIGRNFPVIFSPESGRSEMLITPRDFEIYNLVFPDSLDWVKEYVDKNSYRL